MIPNIHNLLNDRGLRAAWLNSDGVTSKVVNNYALPRLVKEWDYGLLQFSRAQIQPSPNCNVINALQKMRIPILIIHGDSDSLVPLRNSVNLVNTINARNVNNTVENVDLAELVVVRAGHVPHEEVPILFLDKVQNFLQKHGVL